MIHVSTSFCIARRCNRLIRRQQAILPTKPICRIVLARSTSRYPRRLVSSRLALRHKSDSKERSTYLEQSCQPQEWNGLCPRSGMEMCSGHHRWPMLALERHSSHAAVEDISSNEPARTRQGFGLGRGDMYANSAGVDLEWARVELERSGRRGTTCKVTEQGHGSCAHGRWEERISLQVLERPLIEVDSEILHPSNGRTRIELAVPQFPPHFSLSFIDTRVQYSLTYIFS